MARIERRGEKWRVLIRLKGHPSASRSFHSKRTAEEWARTTEDAMRAGKGLGERLTLKELIDRYERELRKFGTVTATKRGHLRQWTVALGDRDVGSLSGADVTAHVQKRTAGPATMQMEVGVLAEVLAAGRSLWGLTIPDVVAAARPTLRRTKAVGKSKERDRRPTDDELDKLAAYYRYNFGDIPMRDIVPFAIETAMRQSEITRLRWGDYQPGPKPMILIRDRKDPKEKIGNDQWVPLLGESAAIIDRQERSGPLVFPYVPGSIGAAFRRACERLQIVDLKFHDLRHEGISRLFEQGYAIEQVALVSGHKDWKALKRYANLRPISLHR